MLINILRKWAVKGLIVIFSALTSVQANSFGQIWKKNLHLYYPLLSKAKPRPNDETVVYWYKFF